MASTEKITGNIGLPKVSVSTDGGSVFNPIAELIEPAMPEGSTDSYETTHTDISDNAKTFCPGWSDDGEVTWVFNYNETTYEQLRALVETELDWKIEWTDPTHTTTDPALDFNGFITTKPTIDMAMEDRWTVSITIKVSGVAGFTAGT